MASRETVAAGMVCAARLSERVCGFDPVQTGRLVDLVSAAGLPVAPPKIGVERWLDLMGHDKKVDASALRFVLLERLGAAVLRANVSDAAVPAALAR